MWDLSCPDWEHRLRSGQSLVPPLPLDDVQANKAVAIFNKLRLADVAGNPTMEEAAGEWFRDILRAIFGSYDPVLKERMIRELFALIAKKNSKTSYGALLMVTALLMNTRPNAKFIMTAPTQDITELAYAQAAGAIELDPVLKARLHTKDHQKTIIDRKTGAHLEIMSFDPQVLTGQKPAGILIDELHVCAKMAKASSAIRQLRGGMIAAPEAFMVFITTQSEEPPVGAMRAELTKARAIRDGKREGRMLPILYEFTEAQQRDAKFWKDPANWPLVLPNLGRSITLKRLIEEFNTASETSEEELRAWASQHLNIEIGLALRSDAWAGAEYWEQQADKELTLDVIIARSEVIVVGIDGGGLDDLMGLAVLGRCRATRKWLLWCRAWAQPKVLVRRQDIAPKLLDLKESGDLTICDRVGEDLDEIADICEQIDAAGLLAMVGLDPVGIGGVIEALAAKDIGGENDPSETNRIVGVSQGWKLTGAIKTAERKLADETLEHADQPLMDWCVGNAKVEPRGNAIVITKQASGNAKIDPLMAGFNSIVCMSTNPPAMSGGSAYDDPNVEV
jgi:phage terminase large subunit-like protein